MGAQKTPIQKTYEINVGQNSINIDFLGSNRQFDWLEISLVFDKSDKHTSIYDSYNVELAAKYIKSLKFSNFTEIYTLANEKIYDVGNLSQKHLLYKQFVVWSCNGCSVTPLIDYISNPIYQELVDEDNYNKTKSVEWVYLDLRASSAYTNEAEELERNDSKINFEIVLKESAKKKLRARVWAHSLGEYLYILSRSGLTLHHKTYGISQQDKDFLE